MDELERRIRAARPISGHRDLPLSDRAKRDLAELLLEGTASPPRPRRSRLRSLRIAGAAVAAISIAMVAIVAATSVLQPQASYAATPPLLVVSETSDTASEWLTTVRDALDEETVELDTDPVTIHVEAWVRAATNDGDAISSTIIPEEYAFTRGPDGSFGTRVTFGQPVDRKGKPVNGGDAPSAGQLKWQEDWAAGEYMFLFADSFPEAPDAVGPFLATLGGTQGELSASAAIQAINSLLMEQQLNPLQRSALLTYLAGLPDLCTEGEVTDRLDREGMLFSAHNTDNPELEDHIVISTTGQILATETLYTGTSRTDIASPSIINYYAWKQEP